MTLASLSRALLLSLIGAGTLLSLCPLSVSAAPNFSPARARLGHAISPGQHEQHEHQERAAPTVCNGHAELCDRSFGNVTFVGAHDSYAVGSQTGANQNVDITVQLNDGIRMLQAQAHNSTVTSASPSGIELCHTYCALLDGGSLETYLGKVKNWLDSNPNEVISILFVNSDDLPVSRWQAAFQSSGMEQYAYAPASASLANTAWPTLGELISQNKRAVVFMDNGANFDTVPYIIDEFTNIWETPYDVTDASFPCTVNRVNGSPDGKMYLINHFLDTNITIPFVNQQVPVPDTSKINTTNAASGPGSLGDQALQCAAQHGTWPNFMLVDFYDEPSDGAVFQVGATANGVTYTPKQVGNTTTSSSSSGSKNAAPASFAARLDARTVTAVVIALVGGAVAL